MRIDEAIHEQELYLMHSDQWEHDRLDSAIQLSNEALELIREKRLGNHYITHSPLPGETE